MRVILAFLVVAATIAVTHSAQPWEMKKKLRDMHADISELLTHLRDAEDSDCLDGRGLVRDLKKRVNTARRIRNILRNEKRKCKAWINSKINELDACNEYIELAFRMRDDGNGLELKTEILTDKTKVACNPKQTWFRIYDGDYKGPGTADLLVRQCPPIAGCGGTNITNLVRISDLSDSDTEGTITYRMDFKNPECQQFNGITRTISAKTCPDSLYERVYSLPEDGCENSLGGDGLCDLNRI